MKFNLMNFHAVKLKILPLLIALIIASVASEPLFAKTVWNGTAQIYDNSILEQKCIQLDGDWEFYYGQLLSGIDSHQMNVNFVEVPYSWTRKHDSTTKRLPAKGYATYRLRIKNLRPNYCYGICSRKSPSSVANIYCNGILVKTYGYFSYTNQNRVCTPVERPVICSLDSDANGEIELVIQVENVASRIAGIISPINFGEYRTVRVHFMITFLLIMLLAGMVFFLFIMNLVMWICDNANMTALYFAILSFSLMMLLLTHDFCVFSWVYEQFPYELQMKIASSIFWISPAIFSQHYRGALRFEKKHPSISNAITFVAITLGIVYILLPGPLASRFELFLVGLHILFSIYSALRIIPTFRDKEIPVGFYMIFLVVVSFFVIADRFVFGPDAALTIDFTQIGLLLLVTIDIVYIALFNQTLISKIAEQVKEQRKVNDVYKKFVPQQFLSLVKKRGVDTVKIGNYTELKMAVLYIQLTTVSPDGSQISTEEDFETVNFYTRYMCECVSRNRGFVSNFLGRGLIALFRSGVNDCMKAAFDIQSEITKINRKRAEEYYPCIACNGGIHYGNLVIGVIGESNRLENSAISDTVNTANRISSVALSLGVPFLVSDYALEQAKATYSSCVKKLNDVHIRGKFSELYLYALMSEEEVESNLEEVEEVDAVLQSDVDKVIRKFE